MTKPRVLVLPGPTMYHTLFAPDIDRALRDFADVTFNDRDENWTSERLAAEIAPYDGLVTCWGSPTVTDAVLDNAPNLKAVAHAAGSVKGYIPEEVLRRGVKVSSAAAAMAPAVAECSLILVFLGLRQIHRYDAAMHSGDPERAWLGLPAFGMGEEIASQRIGVVPRCSGAAGKMRLQNSCSGPEAEANNSASSRLSAAWIVTGRGRDRWYSIKARSSSGEPE